jgi:hypothetical protein
MIVSKIPRNTRWHKVRRVNKLIRGVKEMFDYDLSDYKEDFISDPNLSFEVNAEHNIPSFDEYYAGIEVMKHFKGIIKSSNYRDMHFDSFRKGKMDFR